VPLAYLEEDHGLTHSDASLIAGATREQLAGGPVNDQDQFAARAVSKERRRSIYEALATYIFDPRLLPPTVRKRP
jgi:hypothetical protein